MGCKQVFFAVTLALLVGGTLVDSRAQEASCEAENTRWDAMFKALEEALDAYRAVKEESIAPFIEQKRAERGKAPSLARIVQEALEERSQRLAEAENKCLAAADAERMAFEEWRHCASGPRTRRAAASRGPVAPAVKDRERLLAKLRDLLLDEAYAQYKNYRDPEPSAYSQYGPWGPPPQRIGYQ